ncbi:exo-beta-1,3-glucanase [Trichoderma harzianum]|uniref:Exo-beta-1,3-glucanase n=1 Tax=Trichoderma harzianum TaxID=5544 RepID=A0A0F9XMS0_TRIHA|nr:exo-beta-1,3-glucanase [Trichoderma harzianum]
MKALNRGVLLPILALPHLSQAGFGSGRLVPQIETFVDSIQQEFAAWFDFKADNGLHSKLAGKKPTPPPPTQYWLDKIKHQGVAPFADSDYKVFRNVMDYGAKGDGVTDDTAAINLAMTSGGRCGPDNCSSSTVTPAIVYFPPGTYVVSSPIIDYYFTMMIGDAVNLPTLKASPNFGGVGLGVIDGDKNHIWGPTNIFYRQVANFIIDLTDVPPVNDQGSGPTGIHWPTAQATSIQNVRIVMSDAPNTAHQGIFMEDGSGGFLTDITFIGGKFGAQFGSQQFTMRNLTFHNAQTAIRQGFDWGWTYAGITINNCSVGLDMSAVDGNGALSVGGITMIDSSVSDTDIFIKTAKTATSKPVGAGNLNLENIQLSNVPIAIQGPTGNTVLAGSTGHTTIKGYVTGNTYNPHGPTYVDGPATPFPRPSSLTIGSGSFYTRSKPLYANLDVSDFLSARDLGAKGDAVTDDTKALNAAIATAVRKGKVLFVDGGIYKVTSTIKIPPGARIVGEAFSNIMGSGPFFSKASAPQPVVQVGLPGQFGQIEWSNMVVSTQGSTSGAIVIEYNLASTASNPSGMWDVHVRVGGFQGSNLQLANCPQNIGSDTINPNCIAAHTMMHVTPVAQGLYMENCWLWASDHDIEDPSLRMIDVYSVRGLLVESTVGNIWLWGTAVEHNALYQYEFSKTQNIFMGFIQTETAYYQPHPNATQFQSPSNLITSIFGSTDPDFNYFCQGRSGVCKDGWALRVLSSRDILCYGAGLYSFFNDHSTTCSNTDQENCQTQIVGIDSGAPKSLLSSIFSKKSQVRVYSLNTVGSVSMATVQNVDTVFQKDNTGPFPQGVSLFESL